MKNDKKNTRQRKKHNNRTENNTKSNREKKEDSQRQIELYKIDNNANNKVDRNTTTHSHDIRSHEDLSHENVSTRAETALVKHSSQQDSSCRVTQLDTTKPVSTPFFSSTDHLWMAAHCNQLALEITGHSQSSIPVIVIDDHERHPRIVATNTIANQAGIHAGMLLSVAHTLIDNLNVHVHNPAAIQTRLHHLADVASTFTSTVSLKPPDMLLLEVLGSLKLFGSLEFLQQQLKQIFQQHGHLVHCATSPSASAALLMAKAGIYVNTQDQASTIQQVRSVSIQYLDLTDKQWRTLSGMGVRTLNDLLRLPRDGLARRITPAFLNHLDRIRGKAADSISVYQPTRHFTLEHCFDEPVDNVHFLLAIANRLINALAQELTTRCAAVHELTWTMTHTDHAPTEVKLVLTHAIRRAEHLLLLVAERFERVTLVEAVDTLILTTSNFEFAQGHSLDLFPTLPGQDSQAAFELLDRLRSRLGELAVSGLDLVAEHRPEHAWKPCSPDQTDRHATLNRSQQRISPISERPLWLLQPPQQLTMIKGQPQFRGPLTLMDSQERIESGWWDHAPMQRDYYIAVNRQGTRLWIYQDISQNSRSKWYWYLHGIFS